MKHLARWIGTAFAAALLCTLAVTAAGAESPGEWQTGEDGKQYWYENGVKQGTEGRGKEIYDPASDAWYWLDAVQGGAKAVDKEVYMDYEGMQGAPKWVRYDDEGRMVKGWYTNDNGTYYYDLITGAMSKGDVLLDGVHYGFNAVTGVMLDKAWLNINGADYWYEGGIRQGTEDRGKEIYDPASDAWYWLDAIQGGAKAVSKEVYMDYEGMQGDPKWVRYNDTGAMVKGWYTNDNGTYYYDLITGAMTKGVATIDGQVCCFDWASGVQQTGTRADNMRRAQEVVNLVNQERANNGLAPLTIDPTMAAAAELRSRELEQSFSHTRPDGTTCFTVLEQSGIDYLMAGENIAAGYTSPNSVMTAWMNSPGHRANILRSEFDHIGVGCYESNGYLYWVQLFTWAI